MLGKRKARLEKSCDILKKLNMLHSSSRYALLVTQRIQMWESCV